MKKAVSLRFGLVLSFPHRADQDAEQHGTRHAQQDLRSWDGRGRRSSPNKMGRGCTRGRWPADGTTACACYTGRWPADDTQRACHDRASAGVHRPGAGIIPSSRLIVKLGSSIVEFFAAQRCPDRHNYLTWIRPVPPPEGRRGALVGTTSSTLLAELTVVDLDEPFEVTLVEHMETL